MDTMTFSCTTYIYLTCIYPVWLVAVPYYCARGSSVTALRCMDNPGGVNVPTLIAQANTYASNGRISATSNINGDPVFIYHGSLDSVVLPGEDTNLCILVVHIVYSLNFARFLDSRTWKAQQLTSCPFTPILEQMLQHRRLLLLSMVRWDFTLITRFYHTYQLTYWVSHRLCQEYSLS